MYSQFSAVLLCIPILRPLTMKFLFFWQYVLSLALQILLSNGYSHSKYKDLNLTSDNSFDFIVFTQHWPQTVCFKWQEKSETYKCNLPNDEEWTIHGIWPTQYDKIGPLFCNKTLHFDIATLKSIEEMLKIKWLDVEHKTKPELFWKHEWEKHGTCASVLDSMNTEKKYFQTGLDLIDKYDMKNVLGKASIYPGNHYPIQVILDGIKKILKVNTQVLCVKNPKNHQSYIFEIRICFDKTLRLIDCNGIKGSPSDCNNSEDVIYPGTVPQQISVIQI